MGVCKQNNRCHQVSLLHGFFLYVWANGQFGEDISYYQLILKIWYRAIDVSRKGYASAGELNLFSGLVSCIPITTGNRESHWGEAPARGSWPRYYCSTSVLELIRIRVNKPKCIVISPVNLPLHLLHWHITCRGLIICCYPAEDRYTTTTRWAPLMCLLYSVGVSYIQQRKQVYFGDEMVEHNDHGDCRLTINLQIWTLNKE